MKNMIAASAALNQTPFDWDNNLQHIKSTIETSKDAGVNLLCLPSLCISGAGCADLFLHPFIAKKCEEYFNKVLELSSDITIALSTALPCNDILYKVNCLISNQKILGICPAEIFDTRLITESRYLKKATDGTQILGHTVKKQIFKFAGTSLAFFEDRELNPDIIVCPEARIFSFNNYLEHKNKLLTLSKEKNCSIISANLLGNESGAFIYDGGSFIVSDGKIVNTTARFSYQDYTLCFSNQQLKQVTWEDSKTLKEEEFARAVSLGLFDYLRKCRCHGFTLSLSGGADSGTCATMVWLMKELGVRELGDVFYKKLHLTGKTEFKNLLTCIYQASSQSSNTTFEAARSLAEALNATFLNCSVAAQIQQYIDNTENLLQRKLLWKTDDTALQNIQARARAPQAWFIANLKNDLLLVTSNRSEAAVGYATMDGDTAGSLAPIAGVDKHFIRKWLKWMEKTGVDNKLCVQALSAINNQSPTAELRPAEYAQTDEDDLMPYEILQDIEEAFILKRLNPAEILEELSKKYSYPKETLEAWLKKFLRLFSQNQWKRVRSATSFHLDSYDLADYFHFPVLNGQILFQD